MMSPALFLFLGFVLVALSDGFSKEERISLREEVRSMFYHAFYSYLNHTKGLFDEIKPISCEPRGRENRGSLDDPLGEYSLTLIESLGTLIVLGDIDAFNNALEIVLSSVHFDKDVVVSVFEANIRVVGGLLSTHLLIKERNLTPEYDDQLLFMARDLVDRLLPAFKTPTGIPLARVNLRWGIFPEKTPETNTASVGTLILEFGLLSRLLSDPIYEQVANRALIALWERRSQFGLLGNTINPLTGAWIDKTCSIGAGIDSFYEYVLKSYLFFGNEDHLDIFHESYNVVSTHLLNDGWYLRRDMDNLKIKESWVDSLSAFWPGLQAMIDDVPGARISHDNFLSIWRHYGGLPERFDVLTGKAIPGFFFYPLRPEFVESTYLLYRKTKDPHFLQVGKEILSVLQRSQVECGFAMVSDVLTNELEDRMDSFFLSETLKYLFLLFDEENFVHEGSYMLTTEAHLLPMNQTYSLPYSLLFHTNSRRTRRRGPNFWDTFTLACLFAPNLYLYVLLYRKRRVLRNN